MSTPEIISASAGSGKTHKIATILRDAITKDGVSPDAIIATTFTNKAAAELQERMRMFLLEAGRATDAARLDGARIGTVNGVCHQLVAEFAFQLGLSPEIRILDEDEAQVELKRSLSEVMEDRDTESQRKILGRMCDFTWERVNEIVNDVAKAARVNNLTSRDLIQTCMTRSIERFDALRDGNDVEDGEKLDKALQEALAGLVHQVDAMEARFVAQNAKANGEAKKARVLVKTAKARTSSQDALRILESRSLPWNEWHALSKINVGTRDVDKEVIDAGELVERTAARHGLHAQLWADARSAIELVFHFAAKVLDAYELRKKNLGAIDFDDQQYYALKLLNDGDVREHLRRQVRLVVVDEFQDTSPIQLAIFLKLSEIADRCVWVGDQKQAIYGFRETDPALMDSCIQAMQSTESLSTSYRSRPKLVHLTSELFARAFDPLGIPPDRVKLDPQSPSESEGLGPVLEHWRLDPYKPSDGTGKKGNASNAHALRSLAASMKAFRHDDTVKVRDEKGRARACAYRDIAVLCRTRSQCALVAAELKRLGIPVVVSQTGLLATPECTVALAGLARWIDRKDTLAAAQLARLIDFPDDPDGWLSAALIYGESSAFADVPVVQHLDKRQKASPHVGPVTALDMVMEEVDLRDLCARWGQKETRHANLDAFRGYAVAYAKSCNTSNRSCTPAGLLARFDELSKSESDNQAVMTGENAVEISTWHSAKGLEWPITVLYGHDWEDDVFGVKTVERDEAFDPAEPLAGRWIRYWPNPYQENNKNTPVHQMIAQHKEAEVERERAAREHLRLLYVAWTRARDRVILAEKVGKDRASELSNGILRALRDENGDSLTPPLKEEGRTTWAGVEFAGQVRDGQAIDPVKRKPKADAAYDAPGIRSHPAALLSPSTLELPGSIGKEERIGERISVGKASDWRYVGNALHDFFAADRPELDQSMREQIADRLLHAWAVESALRVADVVGAGDRLRRWIDGKWPTARWLREWPLAQRLPEGTIVRGQADLVLDTEQGFVIIDHKTFPGKVNEALNRAGKHAGQIAAYARILSETGGKHLIASYIHLPVLGLMVPVMGTGEPEQPSGKELAECS